jgi:hypothetical protein
MRDWNVLLKQMFVWCLLSSPLHGDDYVSYLDPAKAGPDFQIQGEYVGVVGNAHPIAAQVIALSNGEFEGILYAGGLPGAGWDGVGRFAFAGKTISGVTEFHGMHGERLGFVNPNFLGVYAQGSIRGTADMFLNVVKDAAFTLKKIERKSPTLGARPPEGAVVLFDGTSTSAWENGKLVENDLLDNGAISKRKFRNHFIHVEFRCPFMPTASGMKRGNSGLFVKNMWEIQILDSFGWNRDNRKFERLSAFGRCGGIEEMAAPELNAALPPLSWQTYDIEFRDTVFDSNGTKLRPAMITVHLNGIRIHNRVVLPPAPPEPEKSRATEGMPGALYLQQHGNPVRFRNIWVIERP